MQLFFNNFFKVVICAFVSTLVWSCQSLESSVFVSPTIVEQAQVSGSNFAKLPLVTKTTSYRKVNYSVNANELAFDGTGNTVDIKSLKDTVIIFIEGGPKHLQGLNDLKYMKEYILKNDGYPGDPSSKWYFPNHSVIGVQQMHFLNPTVFGSGKSFTESNAEEVNSQTIEMIDKVVSWLKQNNKVVFLFGHSNGSFVVQNYMSNGKTQPSYYVITGTRLKPLSQFVQNYANLTDVVFPDGITPLMRKIPENELDYFNVLAKLQLNHNKNYISLLAGNPMLLKTIYGLGLKDEALGKVDNDEMSFLNKNMFTTFYFPEGTHGDAASDGIIYALKTFRKK